jgi:hypothetical protein
MDRRPKARGSAEGHRRGRGCRCRDNFEGDGRSSVRSLDAPSSPPPPARPLRHPRITLRTPNTWRQPRAPVRFANLGVIPADLAVYARLPKMHPDESRPRTGPARVIRLLQVLRLSPSTTAPRPTCWSSTPWAPRRPRPCGSRTTPARCSDTGAAPCRQGKQSRHHAVDRRPDPRPAMPTPAPPSTTIATAATSTDTAFTSQRLRRRRLTNHP